MRYTLLDHNEDFVVVNKWSGIQVQTPQHVVSKEAATSLLKLVARDLGLEKLYPVHRLDEPTSGIVIMAKTLAANQELSAVFAARQATKYYIALSDRKPRKKQGAVIGDMAKARNGSWKLLPGRDNPAITQFFSVSLWPGVRLYLLKPRTGKTHQLRVMLKSLGVPILGDERYGGTDADRLYLHAWQLSVPFRGEIKHYQCLPSQGKHFADEKCHQQLLVWQDAQSLGWPELP